MPAQHELERDLGYLLRVGVTIAAVAVLAGGVWFLLRHGAERPEYGRFVADPMASRGIAEVFRGIPAGESRGLIQLGLLLLIATPVARVAFSLYLFARIRDSIYCAITAIVLAVLLFSLR